MLNSTLNDLAFCKRLPRAPKSSPGDGEGVVPTHPFQKFPFPGAGLRLAQDQIYFLVSFSRSGPAFNKDKCPHTDLTQQTPSGKRAPASPSTPRRTRTRTFTLKRPRASRRSAAGESGPEEKACGVLPPS